MNDEDEIFMQKNNFKFIEVIGQGGYGIIFKIYIPQYQQTFALKKIPSGKFSKEEISSMIAIESNSIVSLYKFYLFENNVYLLMEYCPDSLDKIVMQCQSKEKILNIEQIYNIAIGITKSLEECHDRQIIHGDVKPSNFLIDNYGRFKICDFGLSHKQIGESTNSFCGTLFFCAPEVINKKPYDGYKADVWALGVTLYIIATNGKSPWDLTTTKDLMKSINNIEYNEESVRDQYLRDIIKKCFNPIPEKRPTMKEIFEFLCNAKTKVSPLCIKARTTRLEMKKLVKPKISSTHLNLSKTPKFFSGIMLLHTRRTSNIC